MIVHRSVLLEEVQRYLVPPTDAGVMVDATLGEGGHSEAFLRRYPGIFLVGVDTDASIMEVARERLAPFAGRFRLVNAWFSAFFTDWESTGRPEGGALPPPDLILMDLGISRFHYEASGRGFSFDRDEALDMRLGAGLDMTAADIVNSYEPAELADILFRFGEEKHARSIASRIVRERAKAPIENAARLADIVSSAVPPEYRHRRIHPATRTFQALRIAVNRELEELEQGLAAAVAVLKPGGRVGVITFHSLEDRIVKRFFREKAKDCTCPPEWPICQCGGTAELRLVTTKPVSASEEEVALNPASRSAKLRVAEKLEKRGERAGGPA